MIQRQQQTKDWILLSHVHRNSWNEDCYRLIWLICQDAGFCPSYGVSWFAFLFKKKRQIINELLNQLISPASSLHCLSRTFDSVQSENVKVKKPQWKLSVVLADVLDHRVYFCLSGSLYYVFNNFLVKHNLMSFLYKIKVVQLFTLRFFLNKNFLKKQSFYKWYSTMNIQWQVQ